MSTTITLSIGAGVGTILLRQEKESRPPTLDHPTLDQLDAMIAEAETAAAAGRLRVLFIASASPRSFCAGANVEALADLGPATIERWIRHGHAVFARLEDLGVPTVARVEGYALGGGLELALACDLIFAADTAQLGLTEARLGFVAGWGGSWRLPRRVGLARAKELLFSGRAIAAGEAHRLGLVDFFGPEAALAARCERFAADVAAGSPASHRGHKRLLADAAGRAAAADAEAAASVACVSSADTQARVQAFLSRRKSPPS